MDLLPINIRLPFPEFRTDALPYHIVLRVGLLSLGIVFLSFLHVVPRTASLAPVYRRVCIFSIFFIFSPVDGHSGCFQVGATMRTKAAVDIHIRVLVRRSVFASPG